MGVQGPSKAQGSVTAPRSLPVCPRWHACGFTAPFPATTTTIAVPYASSYFAGGKGSLPAWPVRAACKSLASASLAKNDAALLKAMAKAVNVYFNASGANTCLTWKSVRMCPAGLEGFLPLRRPGHGARAGAGWWVNWPRPVVGLGTQPRCGAAVAARCLATGPVRRRPCSPLLRQCRTRLPQRSATRRTGST